MMSQDEILLLAHLLRRAGFGATRNELESYAEKGYEETIEELLRPEETPPALDDDDVSRRYHVDQNNLMLIASCQTHWLSRMIKTTRPLEEKLTLFWHGLFATGYTKLNQPMAILRQIDIFRRYGLGSFDDLLVEVSMNPAMIFWLDNKDNHKDAVNENYGRELLELFSMGVGNYTEDDVRQASRSFTGWTIRDASLHTTRAARDSIWPYGRLYWQFQYKGDDHDEGQKTFLGESSDFNGQEIIDIICRKPATARFISRHLYNFFVADEPQVPAWETVPPRDPDAIDALTETYFSSGYQISSMLRVLFNSAFFKEAAFERVKSPTELVVGTARLAGGYDLPQVTDVRLAQVTDYMGQSLLDPPSVEGWHTGKEWINTAGLVQRINFAVEEFSDGERPGVRSIIEGVKARGLGLSPEQLVDACLDLMGPLAVSEDTREELLAYASMGEPIRFGSADEDHTSKEKIKGMLQMIVATREYQFA